MSNRVIFDSNDIVNIIKQLEDMRCMSTSIKLCDVISGEEKNHVVFIGPAYYQCLKTNDNNNNNKTLYPFLMSHALTKN